VGDAAMILDRSVIEPDTRIASELLVGSITAVTSETEHSSRSLLMGVPALKLTRMASWDQETMQINGEPLSHSLLFYMCGIYFQVIISVLLLAALYSNALVYFWASTNHSKPITFGMTFVALPFVLIPLVVMPLILCYVVKRLLIGNYKELQSRGVMRTDSPTFFQWMLSNALIHRACGMPLQLVDEFWLTATFWKSLGASIGKKVQLDSNVLLLEADLLEIGDNCRIEEEATLLCHKFNNGGLEVAPIVLPSNTHVGSRAVILPGSEILDQHVTIHPLTPVNPGEMPTVGNWQGSPAEKVDVESGEM